MEEMVPKDRVDAAITLQPVDRVPIIPIIDAFAIRFQGVKLSKVIHDLDLYRECLIKTFDDFSGWDAPEYPGGGITDVGLGMLGMSMKLPGYDLPEDQVWQIDEKEVMKVDDYEFLLTNGYNAYLEYAYPRLGYPCPPDQYYPRLIEMGAQSAKDLLIWEAKGFQVLSVGGGPVPFEAFSFTRSLKETVMDIHRRPEMLEAALDIIQAETVPATIAMFQESKNASRWGPRVNFYAASRMTLLSPAHFDKYFWKYARSTVEQNIEAGITPLFHLDSNWDRYIERFLELPKGQVVVELDSTTDIFKAKQILKGHTCIKGDVSASLLKLGTPEEVTAYVKKLIDVVGEDGGFILSTGCECPVDAKPENIKAMIDTGNSYYPHHKNF